MMYSFFVFNVQANWSNNFHMRLVVGSRTLFQARLLPSFFEILESSIDGCVINLKH